jgi:hypothetical protein|tara:strand:+ start:359 stop:544 length:186 start_codon:yes stop_codon:yes gene_type:complete
MGMLLMLKEGKNEFRIDIDSKGSDEIESSLYLVEDEAEKSGEFTMATFGISAYAKEIERTA